MIKRLSFLVTSFFLLFFLGVLIQGKQFANLEDVTSFSYIYGDHYYINGKVVPFKSDRNTCVTISLPLTEPNLRVYLALKSDIFKGNVQVHPSTSWRGHMFIEDPRTQVPKNEFLAVYQTNTQDILRGHIITMLDSSFPEKKKLGDFHNTNATLYYNLTLANGPSFVWCVRMNFMVDPTYREVPLYSSSQLSNKFNSFFIPKVSVFVLTAYNEKVDLPKNTLIGFQTTQSGTKFLYLPSKLQSYRFTPHWYSIYGYPKPLDVLSPSNDLKDKEESTSSKDPNECKKSNQCDHPKQDKDSNSCDDSKGSDDSKPCNDLNSCQQLSSSNDLIEDEKKENSGGTADLESTSDTINRMKLPNATRYMGIFLMVLIF
ncbi:hypothetical protein HMI54_010130 [Coelomomyces lativittatus]|nr:hypothetical protein HMI55_001954 [Coelomomyces lativittatus]KAJ1511999.1 hypothetical protein HMI56_004654 [Coelomomyces lativittatus]KAJ1516281.1 hypothetical protein HMI54_010130 [Coelomomyces lativittatus]